VIWAGVNDEVVQPTLAVTFIGENDRTDAGYEKWRYICEATTGKILYQEPVISFTDITGTVQGMATEGAKSAECNPESLVTYPWAKVGIQGGTTVYADGNGNFTIPNSGTSAVTVQSFVDGLRFTVDNRAGAEETLSQSVTPPGPANFVHNQANTDELVRAQVNAYVSANGVRDWVLVQNPSFPGIPSETLSPIVVNRTDLYCPGNAWSDPSDGSINFCRSGSGYPNTAWQSVVNHEYGHHVIDQTSSGQGEYGEGMADCHSMLPVDDPVLGYGFFGDCNTGLRNAENTCQYSASGCSTCGSEIHDCGQLLSGCVWDTRQELGITNPSTALAIISNLTINSILVHTGTSINSQICIDFLTLDDDDADLYNGTPHYDEITTGFAAHNMWNGLPPQNDNCSGAVPACPTNTYTGTTSGKTVDGSAGCGSSNSTPDAWYKYKPLTNGTLTLELCQSGYDTVLSVHTGCPGTSGNQVACNDDTGWFGACGILPTSQSALNVSVTAGTMYYIRISGKNGATGDYVLEVSGPACAAMETCSDGILNQGEQRIDCGGPCPACQCLADATCDDGAFCTGNETCDAYGHCQNGSYPCMAGQWCDEVGNTCVPNPSFLGNADSVGTRCNLLLSGGQSEPRSGAVRQLHFHFNGPPSGVGPVVQWATCANPTFQAYAGASVMSCVRNGNDLRCTFTPALEGTHTYRFDFTGLATGNPTFDVRGLVGDVNNSGTVTGADVSTINANWGSTNCGADVNESGTAGGADVSTVNANWGACAP
jgi:hypothetical protein